MTSQITSFMTESVSIQFFLFISQTFIQIFFAALLLLSGDAEIKLATKPSLRQGFLTYANGFSYFWQLRWSFPFEII